MKRTLIFICLAFALLAGFAFASEVPPVDHETFSTSQSRTINEKDDFSAGGTWTSMISGTKSQLFGVWGGSATDVFAVGSGGAILHYDGSSWQSMSSPASDDIEGIWGNSADDVWAVEYYCDWGPLVECYGGLIHYDGTTWARSASAPTSEVHGIWTMSPHIFVVGDVGIVWHYNGSSWSQDTPTTASLEGVWGSSASNVFAVGANGTILRYNGSSWGSISSGTTKDLWGVWGSSASNVFAVGKNGTILRYNGTSWTSMTSGTESWLFGVWGSSAADVFAVGEAGTILHYNGSAWSSMSSGTGKQLEGVWGSSSNNVFAVGAEGTILHYTESTVTTPTVATTAVTAITDTTASSGGNVTSDGGAAVTARGVCWSTSVNPTTSNSKTTDGTGTGSFLSAITGLSPKTPYHVRAYATNSVGTAYGSDVSFTTLDASLMPTVTTTAVSSISYDSASSGGNVTGDGGAAVTVRGVCWSTSANPTTSNNKTTDGTGTGSFLSAITGLSPKTPYHVRAYATNSVGTAYGSDVAFTTLDASLIPTVTTTAVSSISYNSASSGGNVTSDGGSPVTQRGVCWSTSVNPNTSNNKTTNGTGTGSFLGAITGLSLKTPYHVRAYATNSVGTAYGSDVAFTTLDASILYVSKVGCGAKTPCYPTIQGAVNAAGADVTIKIAEGTYAELITLSEPKSLTLQGGWDSSFGSQTGTTILRQAPKAPQGSLTLQMLIIKP